MIKYMEEFAYNHPNYYYALNELGANYIKVHFYKYLTFILKSKNWLMNRIIYFLSGKTRVRGAQLYRSLDTINAAADIITKSIY